MHVWGDPCTRIVARVVDVPDCPDVLQCVHWYPYDSTIHSSTLTYWLLPPCAERTVVQRGGAGALACRPRTREAPAEARAEWVAAAAAARQEMIDSGAVSAERYSALQAALRAYRAP